MMNIPHFPVPDRLEIILGRQVILMLVPFPLVFITLLIDLLVVDLAR